MRPSMLLVTALVFMMPSVLATGEYKQKVKPLPGMDDTSTYMKYYPDNTMEDYA